MFGSGLVDDHLGRTQQLVVPQEAGAHLFHHDARADGHVLRCADHAPHAGIEPPPRHLDPYHAALGQDAIEPSQRDAEAFPPALRLGLLSPAPALEPARRRHGGLLQPGGQPVAQVEQFKQQWPQQGPPAFPSLGPHAHQFLFQRGVARLQRGEDAAKLIERLFHQAGFGAHLVAHRGQLDEHREQVRLCALPRPVPRVLPRCCPDSSETGPTVFP